MVAPTYVTRKMQICSLVIEISNPACSLKILVSVITHSAPSGLKTALLVNVESSAPVPSGLLTRLYSSQNLDPYYTCRDVCDDVKLQKKLKKKLSNLQQSSNIISNPQLVFTLKNLASSVTHNATKWVKTSLLIINDSVPVLSDFLTQLHSSQNNKP